VRAKQKLFLAGKLLDTARTLATTLHSTMHAEKTALVAEQKKKKNNSYQPPNNTILLRNILGAAEPVRAMRGKGN
jgi:hypothetical protein